jgi:O-antigen/teichoic acid export membrane protein
MVVLLKSGIAGVFIAKLTTCSILAFTLIFIQRIQFISKFSFNDLKKLLFFSLPGYPAVISRSIMTFLPIFFLTIYSSFAVLGIYGVASRISKVLQIFGTSFNKAWNPFAFSNAGEDDEKIIYEKVLKLYAPTLIFIGMSLSLFAREIVSVLTPSNYISASYLVPGICFYNGIIALRPIFVTALYSINKVKLTSYFMIINLIIFVILSMKLVPLYDAKGLIFSLNIAGIISICCFGGAIYRYFRFAMQIRRLCFLLGLACVAVMFVNVFEASFITAIVLKLGFIITWIMLCYGMLFSKTEKTIVKQNIMLGMKRTS